MNAKYCHSCHKQVQVSWVKCPYCESSFTSNNSNHTKHVEPSKNSKVFKEVRKYILIALGIFTGIVILFFLWAINSSPSYTTTSSTTHNSNPIVEEEPSIHTRSNEEETQEETDQTTQPDFMNAQDRTDIPPQYRDALEPIDKEALLDPDVSQDDFLMGLSAIRAQGFKCKSISSVGLMNGGGIRYRCDDFSKKYEVTKEDGVFQVKPD